MADPLQELEQKIPRLVSTWSLWLVIPLVLVLVAGTFALDVTQEARIATGIPYAAVVLIASFSGNRIVTFVTVLVVVAAMVIGYQLTAAAEAPWPEFIDRVQAVAVVCLLAIFLIHRIYVVRQRNQAVTELTETLQRLKLLHGMLPICSSCKKIKTNHGEWTQLESYIQSHSEAEFTHGICNDCAELMYGQFLADEEAKAAARRAAAGTPPPPPAASGERA
jgi:hypothetical protein